MQELLVGERARKLRKRTAIDLGVIEMGPFIIAENHLGRVDPRMETRADETGSTPHVMTHSMKGRGRDEARVLRGRMIR